MFRLALIVCFCEIIYHIWKTKYFQKKLIKSLHTEETSNIQKLTEICRWIARSTYMVESQEAIKIKQIIHYKEKQLISPGEIFSTVLTLENVRESFMVIIKGINLMSL